MNISEWISLVSVIIACIAAIASWRSVVITNKQYKLQNEDRIKKYRPFFKIKSLNRADNNSYWFNVVNEGYPFYVVSNIKWNGDGVIIDKQFNGLMVRSSRRGNTSEEIERYENLTIKIQIKENCTTEGDIEIIGSDIENNDFSYRSPIIKIENGKITNGIELTYQYLK